LKFTSLNARNTMFLATDSAAKRGPVRSTNAALEGAGSAGYRGVPASHQRAGAVSTRHISD